MAARADEGGAMSAEATTGKCPNCQKNAFIMPLHGAQGGPMMCLQCGMEWHAKHTRRRKFGRILAKATRLYLENGGKLSDAKKIVDTVSFAGLGFTLGSDLDPLGYSADTIGADVGDITSELLADILQLTHPDHHPPERRDLAKRVTQDLLALKPFVFPAPKPKPPLTYTPARDGSVKRQAAPSKEPSPPAYPCMLCAETVPYYYCAPCRVEYERRQEQDRERERAKQRAQYARRQQRKRWLRPPKLCAADGCTTQVKAHRKDARYCSPACRQKAYRERVTHIRGAASGTSHIRNGAGAAP
jgi:hypothetical protein